MYFLRVSRWVLYLVGFIVFFYLTLVPLAEIVEAAGVWMAQTVGLAGVFAYVYVVDTLILPASVDFLFPFVLGWAPVPLLAVVGPASVLAGWSGYLIGCNLGRLPWVARFTKIYSGSHLGFVTRHGMWGVVAAALLPIPFSTVSWLAGALGLNPRLYFAAALLRVPRMVLTFLLLRESIGLFA